MVTDKISRSDDGSGGELAESSDGSQDQNSQGWLLSLQNFLAGTAVSGSWFFIFYVPLILGSASQFFSHSNRLTSGFAGSVLNSAMGSTYSGVAYSSSSFFVLVTIALIFWIVFPQLSVRGFTLSQKEKNAPGFASLKRNKVHILSRILFLNICAFAFIWIFIDSFISFYYLLQKQSFMNIRGLLFDEISMIPLDGMLSAGVTLVTLVAALLTILSSLRKSLALLSGALVCITTLVFIWRVFLFENLTESFSQHLYPDFSAVSFLPCFYFLCFLVVATSFFHFVAVPLKGVSTDSKAKNNLHNENKDSIESDKRNDKEQTVGSPQAVLSAHIGWGLTLWFIWFWLATVLTQDRLNVQSIELILDFAWSLDTFLYFRELEPLLFLSVMALALNWISLSLKRMREDIVILFSIERKKATALILCYFVFQVTFYLLITHFGFRGLYMSGIMILMISLLPALGLIAFATSLRSFKYFFKNYDWMRVRKP